MLVYVCFVVLVRVALISSKRAGVCGFKIASVAKHDEIGRLASFIEINER